MERIAITGAAGFIGSELIRTIWDKNINSGSGDFHITAVDNLSTGRADRISPYVGDKHFRFLFGDVTEKRTWTEVGPVSKVYHLADIVGIGRVTANPTATARTALRGISLATEHAAISGADLFYASTSMIYGPGNPVTNEDRPPAFGNHPIWTYAAAKMIGEQVVHEAERKHGLNAIIGRFFNVIGPGQSPDSGHVVARFFHQAKKNERMTVYGTGSDARSFIHVDDATEAITKLMAKIDEIPKEKRTVNIASGGQATSIADLAFEIKKITGSKSIVQVAKIRPGFADIFENTRIRAATGARLRELLPGWDPDQDISEILERIHLVSIVRKYR